MSIMVDTELVPGADLAPSRMPGHWVLARMGKRVLRPGGLALTRHMLAGLGITPADSVVEFAPGLGVTARLTLAQHPAAYTAVERDETAALGLRRFLTGPRQQCLLGSAAETGIPSQSASVVYAEAMLTMQGPAQKAAIVREAFRLLQPGGRYGLHEMCFTPDHFDPSLKREIQDELADTIRVGARPLTAADWRGLLESEGFEIRHEQQVPMRLLEPARLVRDEGLCRAVGFLWNVLRNADCRARVRAMRNIFRKYESHLAAIMLVAVKPS